MGYPKVSVLMPVYNAERYLRAAVRSILLQEFAEFELVALDDGSTDRSLRILRDFESSDPRVRVRTQRNRGVYLTRNELLEESRASLVAWMDADDVAYPSRLRLQVEVLDDDPRAVCVGGWIRIVDSRRRPIEVQRYPTSHESIVEAMFTRGSGMLLPNVTMRRDAAIEVGGFRDLAPFEDFDILMRLSETGGMANVPCCTFDYRLLVSSASRRTGLSWPAMREFIIEMAKDRRRSGTDRLQRGEPLPTNLSGRPDARRDVARLHQSWALSAIANGYPLTYAVHFLHFLRHRLLQLISGSLPYSPWRILQRTWRYFQETLRRLRSRGNA